MSEEKTKTNGLSVVMNNRGHISFNADISFQIQDKEDSVPAHFSDVVSTLVLSSLKEQVESALMGPGDYRLIVTGCVSDVTNTVTGNDNVEDDVDAPEEESAEENSENAEEEEEKTETED